MLSATVGGLLVGSAMPAGFRQVVHPVLTMALIAMSAGQALAWTTGVPLESVFATYLAKGKGPMGAGDLLMSFLGCVILVRRAATVRDTRCITTDTTDCMTPVHPSLSYQLLPTPLYPLPLPQSFGFLICSN